MLLAKDLFEKKLEFPLRIRLLYEVQITFLVRRSRIEVHAPETSTGTVKTVVTDFAEN